MLGVATVEEGVERARGDPPSRRRAGGCRPAAGGGGPRPPPFGNTVRPGTDRLPRPRGGGGGASLPLHVKVDTGMGRLGLLPREAMEAAGQIASTPALRLEGWMTHLSRRTVRRRRTGSTRRRSATFRGCSRRAEGVRGRRRGPRAEQRGDPPVPRRAVRPRPARHRPVRLLPLPPGDASPDLRPVMRVVTKVVSLKGFPRDTR